MHNHDDYSVVKYHHDCPACVNQPKDVPWAHHAYTTHQRTDMDQDQQPLSPEMAAMQTWDALIPIAPTWHEDAVMEPQLRSYESDKWAHYQLTHDRSLTDDQRIKAYNQYLGETGRSDDAVSDSLLRREAFYRDLRAVAEAQASHAMSGVGDLETLIAAGEEINRLDRLIAAVAERRAQQ